MSRRLTAAIIVLATMLANGIWADDTYEVEHMLLLPPTFYVGDLVELRVRISVKTGVIPTEPLELPAPSWIHIRDVRVIPISDDYDIRVSFSTYETGIRELPPITMGDLVLGGIEIETQSIVGNGVTKIEEAFEPSLLPGSRLLLTLSVGVMLILPVVVWIVFVWLRRIMTKIFGLSRERRPHRKLNHRLDELKKLPSPVNNREFYISLADGFRGYLSSRLGQGFGALTSREMQKTLLENYSGIPSVRRIAGELAGFDKAKFGRRKVSPNRRNQDIVAVRDAAVNLELHIAALRGDRKKRRRYRVDA